MAREEYEARGLEHIRAGLTQRRTGPGHSFAHAIGSPRDAGALTKIFQRATAAHEKLVGICDAITAEMIVAGVATESELAEYRGVMSATELSNQRHRKMSGKRRELLAIGREDRAKLAVELSEYFALVEGARDQFESSVAYLMARSLSGKLAEDRARVFNLIQHAGIEETKAAVRDCLARRDVGGLAACMMRIDQHVTADPENRNRLQVNRAEVADLLVKQERMAALCLIEQTSLLVARANVAVHVAETGDSPNSLTKIDLGQRQKRLDSMIAATFPEDADPENPAPSDRIRNPLSE